jgi:hypothetical protein
MEIEFWLSVAAVLIVAGLYFVSAWIKSPKHILQTGLLSTIAGAMMVFLGWWGADAAICTLAAGGKEVWVPFMRTYTPVEWWNINWFVATVGAVLMAFGTFMVGRATGK